MDDEPRDSRVPPTAASTTEAPAQNSTPPAENPPANKLTPEEQMALFEQELKETDWGHQPC